MVEVSTPSHPASAIHTALGSLRERERHVFVARTLLVLGTVPTMQELANAWDVTRQRVEQLQRRAEESIRRQLDEDRFVRSLATDLRMTLGAAYPLAALKDIDALAQMTATEGQPATEREQTLWRTVVWFAGYHLEDGWALTRRRMKPKAMLAGLAERARERGHVTYRDAVTHLAEKGLAPQAADALLLDGPRNLRLFGDVLLPWYPSLTDKAEALLRWLDRPASDQELFDLIGEQRNRRGFRNRLTDDDRFVFTQDGSAFGLREWGLDDPIGLSDAIALWIEGAGGEASIAEIVPGVAAQGSWAESSVRTYAHAPRFVVRDGRIRMRRNGEPFDLPSSDPSDHPRVERIAKDGLRYNVEVVNDTLRGSGRPMAVPLALALGVLPGQERTFTSPSGATTRVVWNVKDPQPTLGSVKTLAEEAGVDLGDALALDFDTTHGYVTAGRLPRSV